MPRAPPAVVNSWSEASVPIDCVPQLSSEFTTVGAHRRVPLPTGPRIAVVPFGILLLALGSVSIGSRTDQRPERWKRGMPRAWWFVAGFLVLASVVGGLLNEHGPFAAHPVLGYQRFLADLRYGQVEQIVQWRNRLEVTEGDELLLVMVPPDRDLTADAGRAIVAGSVGYSWRHIPDAWLGIYTPWVPFLILTAAVLIWTTAIVRNRRFSASYPAST